jgi:hypothetical protein
VLDDIAAIEIDVFHDCAAILAIKNNMLMFARWPPAFDDDPDRIGWADRRVRDIRRNKERFAFPDEVIDDPVPFADADFYVALELIKIFFRIDEMEIVSGIGTLDDHHEKIPAIVKITVADRRLKQVAVLLDPIVDVDRREHPGGGAAPNSLRWRKRGSSDDRAYLFGGVPSTASRPR